MKQFNVFRGLILTILLTCCNSVWAYDIEVDGIYYNITSVTDLTVEVTKGDNEYSGDIVIPSTITYKSKTLTVTSIQGWAFNDSFDLTSIVIPNSVTSIGEFAFYKCSNLTSVVIPNTVTYIGYNAFDGCKNISEVHINSLTAWCNIEFYYATSNPLCYAGNLYLNGELVTELIIPDDVTKIEKFAFCRCESITSVAIPNTVTYIGYDAFDDCENISEVHINSLTAWCNIEFNTSSSNPLYYAKNLYLNGELVTELIIPDDVTKIKNYAFYCCESITSVVIPSSVTSIGVGAFYCCI